MNIVLEEFTRNDFEKLISWISSPEYMIQWCGKTFSFPLDSAQLEKYMLGAEQDPPVRKILKAVDMSANIYFGNITIERIDKAAKQAALTCMLIGDNSYIGQGLCCEIVNSAVKIAFKEIGLETLTLNAFDFNTSAVKCYEKCGFREIEKTILEYDTKKYMNIKMKLTKTDTNL